MRRDGATPQPANPHGAGGGPVRCARPARSVHLGGLDLFAMSESEALSSAFDVMAERPPQRPESPS